MKDKKNSNSPAPRFPMEQKKRSKQRKSKSIKSSSSSSSNDAQRQKVEDLLLLKLPYLFRLPNQMLNDIIDEITPKLIYEFGSMDSYDTLHFFEYSNLLRRYKHLSKRLSHFTKEDKEVLEGITLGSFTCHTLAETLIGYFLVDTLNFRMEYKNLMDRIRRWANILVKAKLLQRGIIRSGENNIPVNRKLYPTYYYFCKHDSPEDIEQEVLSFYRSLGYMLGRIGDKSKTVQKKYEQLEELAFDTSGEGETLNELILENELLKKTQRKGMKIRIIREGVEINKEGIERERKQRAELGKKVKLVQQNLKQFLVTNQKQLKS